MQWEYLFVKFVGTGNSSLNTSIYINGELQVTDQEKYKQNAMYSDTNRNKYNVYDIYSLVQKLGKERWELVSDWGFVSPVYTDRIERYLTFKRLIESPDSE